jgi:hypothetical protein
MRRVQAGATLMEALIAMSISLVVTASMIALMANSLSSTTRIIKMTKLTDDLRVTMQMLSRDLRRSSYNANSISCYGNEDCVSDPNIADDVTIDNQCFEFHLDRDFNGNSNDDPPGGFQRVSRNGVGVIEMWTGDTGPVCGEGADASKWVEITNPENIDISGFAIDENLSYTQVIRDDGVNPPLTQKVRKIRVNVTGSLVKHPAITRQIEDIINVRNDVLLTLTAL